MKSRPHIKILLLIVTATLIALGATTAFARVDNVIVVNSTDDTYIPGDGKCTLREAINNANANSNVAPNSPDCANGFNADFIELGNNLDYELNVVDSGMGVDPNGMPVITSNITINGHGSTIHRSTAGGTPQFRIFKINFSGVLTLNDLAMSNGNTNYDGGGLWNEGSLIMNNSSIRDSNGNQGGGIYTQSYLELNHSAVENNKSGDSLRPGITPAFDGGGIYSSASGKLEIADSSISNNKTGWGGDNGMVSLEIGNGGGIYSLGTLHLTNSQINSNNSGGRGLGGGGTGGGLFLAGTSQTIQNSTIDGNEGNYGAGIANEGGTLSIVRSTISNNKAINNGGGIVATSITNIYNSTIALNSASRGAAVYSYAATLLSYDTVAQNSSSNLGSLVTDNATMTINNSILANNNAPNCFVNGSGSLINGGNNIDSADLCGFGSANNSMSNTNPKLFALSNNGGPTWTMAIAPDSPARDKGDTGVCTNNAGGINNIDERSYLRIKVPSDLCDIGAYEYNAAPGPVNPTETRTPTMTPTNVPPGVTKTPTPPTNTPTPTNTPDPCPTAPNAPVLKSPPAGKIIHNTQVTLKWFASSCADTYNVTVRLKNVVVDSATDLTVLQHKTTGLVAGKNYAWYVSACNDKGCNVSVIRHFKVAP